MTVIPINLAVEDALSEAVLKAILKQTQRSFCIGQCLKRGGYGYIKKIVPGLNHAAKGTPYLVLTDLDQADCPLAIVSGWLTQPQHPNFLFRVAVREVEAWLLAHRDAFSVFLGISTDLIPRNTDTISDPKQLLINLARRSRKRNLRDGIVPVVGSIVKIGKDYNGQFIQFAEQCWHIESAQINSVSLKRTVSTLEQFEPV